MKHELHWILVVYMWGVRGKEEVIDLNHIIKFCDLNELSFECRYFDREMSLEMRYPGAENVVSAYYKKCTDTGYVIDYFIWLNKHIKWIKPEDTK